jgi:hypothetical protein
MRLKRYIQDQKAIKAKERHAVRERRIRYLESLGFHSTIADRMETDEHQVETYLVPVLLAVAVSLGIVFIYLFS